MTWDHTRVEQLLAGQALGVLDPDEAALAERALVEHVRDCRRCRRSLDSYTALAGDLALVPAPAAPPDSLRRRVLGEADRSTRRARPGSALPGWLGAAAAVVAVAALAGSSLRLAGRLDRAEVRQALMVEVMAAVGSPDASVVPMRGAPGVRAAMIYVHEKQEAYFVATGLPAPPGDYQLWLVTPERWVSLGTFAPQGGIALVRAEAEAEDVSRVVVTVEPPGGSERPSGPRVVSATIPGR